MFEIFSYYLGFGGTRFFALFFVFLPVYFTGTLWYHFFYAVAYNRPLPSGLKSLATKVVLTLVMMVICLVVLGFGLEKVVLHAQLSTIVFFSQAFLQIDKMVFGVYVPFWFHDSSNGLKPFFDNFSLLIIIIYRSLPFLLGILFSLLFVIKPQYFYKAFLSFVIMFLIGLPLWFFFPAVSPFDAYIYDVFEAPLPQYLQPALSGYDPNVHLESFLRSIKDLNQESRAQFFAVTTMPSMHIAWAVLILFFGAALWRPLLVFLVPYFLINAFATVYLLQHYTIDIPAGLIVAIISIYLAIMIAKVKTPQIFLS